MMTKPLKIRFLPQRAASGTHPYADADASDPEKS
jgi:hypothetical protein